MNGERKFTTWEEAVVWLRNQPDQRQLVLDAFYDDPLADADRLLASVDAAHFLSGTSGKEALSSLSMQR